MKKETLSIVSIILILAIFIMLFPSGGFENTIKMFAKVTKSITSVLSYPVKQVLRVIGIYIVDINAKYKPIDTKWYWTPFNDYGGAGNQPVYSDSDVAEAKKIAKILEEHGWSYDSQYWSPEYEGQTFSLNNGAKPYIYILINTTKEQYDYIKWYFNF